MARYIDAEKLEEGIFPEVTNWYQEGWNDALKGAMLAIPTADVVERSNEGAECPVCHGTGRIGTSDWLTKHISKEQLAKEKAEAVAEYDRQLKAEVAREIFEEIENIFGKHMLWYRFTEAQYQLYVELKNKYTEEADGKQA